MSAPGPLLAGALVLVAGLAGCSSDSPRATSAPAAAPSSPAAAVSAFDATATRPDCMTHQSKLPTAADKGGAGTDLAHRLAVLRYYTAHGSQSFCDKAPAAAADLAWMRLYVEEGADASHVARWVRPS